MDKRWRLMPAPGRRGCGSKPVHKRGKPHCCAISAPGSKAREASAQHSREGDACKSSCPNYRGVRGLVAPECSAASSPRSASRLAGIDIGNGQQDTGCAIGSIDQARSASTHGASHFDSRTSLSCRPFRIAPIVDFDTSSRSPISRIVKPRSRDQFANSALPETRIGSRSGVVGLGNGSRL